MSEVIFQSGDEVKESSEYILQIIVIKMNV